MFQFGAAKEASLPHSKGLPGRQWRLVDELEHCGAERSCGWGSWMETDSEGGQEREIAFSHTIYPYPNSTQMVCTNGIAR